MIYQGREWLQARFIPVEHPRIRKILSADDKWISPSFVMGNAGFPQLRQEAEAALSVKRRLDEVTRQLNTVEQVMRLPDRRLALSSLATPDFPKEAIERIIANPQERQGMLEERKRLRDQWAEGKAFSEAAIRLVSRVNGLGALHDQFRIVPDPRSLKGDWVMPTNATKPVQPDKYFDAGLAFDRKMAEAFAAGDGAALAPTLEAFLGVVERHEAYPTPRRRDIYNVYHRVNPSKSAAWLYLAGCAAFGVFFFFRTSGWRWTGTAFLLLGMLLQTGAVGARLYLTGHAPVSNLYESVTFVAWCAMLIATVLELRLRNGVVGLLATGAGFLLLSATGLFPLHDTRLHPLRAVLNSYWLNIHVTMMLLSYGAFTLSAFFAGGYLLKSLLGRESLVGATPMMTPLQMEEFAYRLVQIGWPILTVGIMLGGVWADVAWGRFWGWDPKETWAFVTWVAYTMYLHSRMVMGWRGRTSALACIGGYLCVLITWIGVSYLPWFAGGLHSYASPT
jgi:cytochrome c-type biogenesis protein CcsB